MNMKKRMIPLFKLPDLAASQLSLKLFPEKHALLIFFLHGLFQNEEEIKQNLVVPELGLTVDHFRQFIEYYQSQDYTFISQQDIYL